MVSIDVPTAVIAVLISVLLGFLTDNATQVIQRKLKRSSEKTRRINQWYSELEAITDKIMITVITSRTEFQVMTDRISPSREEVKERINDIDVNSFDTLRDLFTLLRQIEGVQGMEIDYEIEIDDNESTDELDEDHQSGSVSLGEVSQDDDDDYRTITTGTSSLETEAEFEGDLDPLDIELSDEQKEEQLKLMKNDLVDGISEIEEEATEEARKKVRSDMEQFYTELRNHFSKRPQDIDEDVFESLTSLMVQCYMKRITGRMDDEDYETMNKKVGNLKDAISDAEI